MDCTSGVRRFVAASLVVAGLASAQAMAKPVAVDDARSQRATSQWTQAQRVEIQQRFELAKGIVQRLKPDAARLGLAADWERATLTMLLMQPASVLMEANAARDYAGVMAVTARHRVEAKALGNASSDLVFKPFTPCRFLDTRNVGGKLAPLPAVRPFDIAQNGAAFGGDAGCAAVTLAGVASDDQIAALAVNIAIVDTSQGAPGFLGIRPAGATQVTALANWTNASPSAQDSNAAIITMDQSAATDEFEVFASSPVHTIIDLLGAFTAPQATVLDCPTFVSQPGSSTAGDLAPSEAKIFSASCGAGYRLTGGGCNYFTPAGGAPLPTDNKVIVNRASQPFDGATQTWENRYICQMTNNDTIIWRAQARAICCRVPGR
jgi:hypothetical protein